MSQISYDIVLNLAKQDNHIRGLAKDLNTNQTTIARKVKELEDQNILDFREEGKNKVYFIKKTLESSTYIKIIEHDKLLDAIKKYPRLRKITEDIRSFKEIELAIIFGSYAKNNADKNSDIDLYILTPDKGSKIKVELSDSKLSVKTGEFNPENLLIKEIIKNHIIIKGVDIYYGLIHQDT